MQLTRQNLSVAKNLSASHRSQLPVLREISQTLGLSISFGDLLMLEGKWYVTHSGLLGIAHGGGALG